MGEIIFNSRILRSPFLIGVFLVRVYHEVQGIFIRGAQVKDLLDLSRVPFTSVSFITSFYLFRLCFLVVSSMHR